MSSRRWCDVRSLSRQGRRAALLPAALLLLCAASAPPTNTLQDLDAQRRARAVDRDADRAGAQTAAAQIVRLRGQLLSLGRQETDGERTVGGARSALGRLSLQESELKVRMGRNQQSLTKLLGALQMYARNPPPPLLVDPRSARDAVRAAILIKAITPELEDRARAFAAQSEALKRVRRESDIQNGVLFQAESAQAEREARIEDLIAQKQALEKQLYADADAAQGDVQRLAARARSLGELVHVLDAHAQPAAGAGSDDALPSRLAPPVTGERVHGFEQAGGDPEHNEGLTWTSDPNATVLAPAAGVVDYAGPLKGWGLVLILRNGDHDLVLAGLGEIGTETGRVVAAGEPVGKMPGDTPRPNLYLEVRRAGRPVDPGPWFSGQAAKAG